MEQGQSVWSVKSQINILKGSQGKETKAENHDPH